MTGRQRLLSSRKTIFFQIVAGVFWAAIPLLMLSQVFITGSGYIFSIMMAATYGIISFREIKKIISLKSIGYDTSFLYVKLEGYEQEIPLDEINNISLKDLIGIHCIELNKIHGKRKIYFKSSLWYPFNFRKIDSEVAELVDLINRKKQEPFTGPVLDPPIYKID